MRKCSVKALGAFAGIALIAGTVDAAGIKVSANIKTSARWTANNTYNLQGQIYVEPDATLTIEGGSLAVSKGAKIYIQGTAAKPVIFTSKVDTATWNAGNPRASGANPAGSGAT